jgi:hypothetical protein
MFPWVDDREPSNVRNLIVGRSSFLPYANHERSKYPISFRGRNQCNKFSVAREHFDDSFAGQIRFVAVLHDESAVQSGPIDL